MSSADAKVAVIGGGVVGCAVAHALARRGISSVVLEAQAGLALGASGTNSGILHTGFDSKPGELETRLILRSAALREELLAELGVNVWRCGARLMPVSDEQQATVADLAKNARVNEVEARLEPDGSLSVPGEAVTDPVAFVHALAGAARAGGGTVQLGARVLGLESAGEQLGVEQISIELERGEQLRVGAIVNCAGLYADDVARLAGDDPVSIYPRKGEFLVFAPPERAPLRQILLPVPSALGKGVLVFPTIDGLLIAGPTAREREDKDDWSVEADASELIRDRAARVYPPLERAEQVGAYAGLRPAGRHGANYVIEPSRTLPSLIHVAAIRSTGLSASLGIGEYVAELLAEHAGIELAPARALPTPAPWSPAGHWWERAAHHHSSQR
ncbi:MAG TPA: FAD-dependent oxidoreductase [Solirubrobacteraceae bacterium]|nr:FAD-dependent oxidoreductase [Solirubrobacteraceae bacterium]